MYPVPTPLQYIACFYQAHAVSYWIMEPPRNINFVLDYANSLLIINFVIDYAMIIIVIVIFVNYI